MAEFFSARLHKLPSGPEVDSMEEQAVGNKKLNKIQIRRQAMWLIAHVRATGAEPLPFEHNSYRSYLSGLQRQYNAIRATMDKESGRRARLAGRALAPLSTL